MTAATPYDTLQQFTSARSRGDVLAAMACYEIDATVVLQPGIVKRGADALHASLTQFISMCGKFDVTDQQIIEGRNVALHMALWTLKGTDADGQPVEVGGRSSDVLRRQPDGTWLIALDNPWGGIMPEPTRDAAGAAVTDTRRPFPLNVRTAGELAPRETAPAGR